MRARVKYLEENKGDKFEEINYFEMLISNLWVNGWFFSGGYFK